jgi:tetratricopeptide (TPR) repeat protein
LVRLKPDAADVRHQVALLQLATNPEGESYRKFATANLEQLGGTDDPEVAYQVARASSLTPGVTDHPERLAALAEKAVTQQPQAGWRRYVFGIALYRAGRYDEAIHQLDASLRLDANWGASAMALPFLAMAHHHLGHPEEAKRWLIQAEQADPSRMWIWWDRLEWKVTLREAQALVREDPLFPKNPFAP